MSKREILVGSTDQTIDIFVQDSSSTTGAGLTGLVFNTAGLTCYYRKGATGTPTALTLATQTIGGAHSDGGFVAADGTNMPGVYRLDLSDTMVAAAGMLTIYLHGATNMAKLPIEIEVVSVNKFDGVRGGMTALPNAAAGASGGLVINGSNSGTVTLAALTVSGATTLAAVSGTTLTLSGAVAFQSTFAVTTSTALGALSCTTLTASGAVAFQSTFAVTTSTALAALSCTTLTASGAVAFQSTFAVTTSTSLAALSATTIAASGTVTLNALTVTNATTLSGAVSLGSTLGVTGATTLAALSMTTLTASGAVAFQSTFAVTTSTSLGALSCTTLTASGAVAFQSTFAVTTSTALAALSCTTLTASGAVAFQSTFAVTTSTSLAAVSATTITASGTTSLAAVTASGTVTLSALTVTNATTLTGAVSATNASNDVRGVKLLAAGLDLVLIESGITAGASLTDDAATQLTSINARQALALVLSAAAAGVLDGAATTTITIKPGGLPAGNTRVSATVTSDGNRTALVLKVPT